MRNNKENYKNYKNISQNNEKEKKIRETCSKNQKNLITVSVGQLFLEIPERFVWSSTVLFDLRFVVFFRQITALSRLMTMTIKKLRAVTLKTFTGTRLVFLNLCAAKFLKILQFARVFKKLVETFKIFPFKVCREKFLNWSQKRLRNTALDSPKTVFNSPRHSSLHLHWERENHLRSVT
jgi:hypothetical protein